MRAFVFVFVLVGSVGVASAQPAGPDTGAPPPPPPAPEPAPAPPPPPPPPHIAPMPQNDVERPTEFAFGIGIGYTFAAATTLESPNTVAVRARLRSGLAFEPILRLQDVSETMSATGGPSTTSTTTELDVGTNVIWPVWKRGRTDFSVLGQISFDTLKNTPDTTVSADNKVTTTFALGYGIEIAFWLTRHWMISMDAVNPFFAYSDTVTNMAGGTSAKDAVTTIGLIHDPTVSLIIHLFD